MSCGLRRRNNQQWKHNEKPNKSEAKEKKCNGEWKHKVVM
jgi:hypothetical protein